MILTILLHVLFWTCFLVLALRTGVALRELIKYFGKGDAIGQLASQILISRDYPILICSLLIYLYHNLKFLL